MKSKHRVIAIYLPQYHPFKENDEWWGKGFTEWTNVTKSRPRFPGHYQPHLPSDLGFYDLRVPEVREQQAQMAKEFGLYGFCYYPYWFNGKLLMERPLQEILESGKPNFPFMICWANENWTRAWDGGEKQILIKQEYTEEDARNHIKWLIPYFKDYRYIRIDDKPVIAIYRTTIIPNLDSMLKIWREEAAKEGIDLYITRFESFGQAGKEYLSSDIDAAIDFQPVSAMMSNYKKKANHKLLQYINSVFFRNRFPKIVNYQKYVNYYIKHWHLPNYKQYPCLTPGWDNTSRRKKNAFLFINNSPSYYAKWLDFIMKHFKPYSQHENFIFINAWNEWAEGNHLEPDRKWGNQFLKKTKEIIQNNE